MPEQKGKSQKNNRTPFSRLANMQSKKEKNPEPQIETPQLRRSQKKKNKSSLNILVLPGLEQQLARRPGLVDEAVGAAVDLAAAQPRLGDDAAQRLVLVRRALVAEKHGARLHDERRLVVEHGDVAVEADAQVALRVLEADLARRVAAAPAHDVLNGDVGTGLRLGPQDGQAEADAADAAPGAEEVAVGAVDVVRVGGAGLGERGGEQLEVGRAGGVVGDDGLDDGVVGARELGPQAVLVGLLADGRAALVPRVALLDALGRQAEVVEARLGRHLDAPSAGLAQHGDCLDRGQVHDVQVEVRGEVGEGEDLGDGVRLEGGRTRVQEGLVGGERARGLQRRLRHLDVVADGGGDRGDHLGVEHDGGGLVCQLGQDLLNVVRSNGGELVDLDWQMVSSFRPV